jgi:hypothetical protein
VVGILALLFATIGLPYFLLSSTSPLVQSWFSRAYPGRSPYPLFALSNFASFSRSSAIRSCSSRGCAMPSNRAAGRSATSSSRSFARRSPTAAARFRDRRAWRRHERRLAAAAPRAILFWLALSAMGSVMLLAVSNHLTQNISSIPLLWVVPLALYLLTFILCFEGRHWYRRDAYLGVLLWSLCMMAWFIADKSLQFELLWQIASSAWASSSCACSATASSRCAARREAPHALLPGGVAGRRHRRHPRGHRGAVTLPGYLELEIALVVVAAWRWRPTAKPLPIVGLSSRSWRSPSAPSAYRIHTFTENTVFIGRNYYGVCA